MRKAFKSQPTPLDELSEVYNSLWKPVRELTPESTPATRPLIEAIEKLLDYGSAAKPLAFDLWRLESSVAQVQEACDVFGTNGAHHLKSYVTVLANRLKPFLAPLDRPYLVKAVALFFAIYDGHAVYSEPSTAREIYLNLLVTPEQSSYRELHLALGELVAAKDSSELPVRRRERIEDAHAALEAQYLLSGYALLPTQEEEA